MLQWIIRDLPSKCEVWVQMEYACNTLNLASILCPPSFPPQNFALTLWSFTQLESGRNLEGISSCKRWCTLPSIVTTTFLLPSTFGVWSSKGMKSISDLYVNGRFASFAQLSNYSIYQSQAFLGIFKLEIVSKKHDFLSRPSNSQWHR